MRINDCMDHEAFAQEEKPEIRNWGLRPPFLFLFAKKTRPFMETNKNRKGFIKMLEMIVLGITVVIAQSIVGIIMMKVMLSKGFLKKYTKMSMDLANEITAELLGEDED